GQPGLRNGEQPVLRFALPLNQTDSRVCPQPLAKRAKCSTSVRNFQFLFARHLRQRPTVWRIQENRVVPEALRAPGRTRDFAFHRLGRLVEHTAAICDRKRADEPCRTWTIGLAIELGKDSCEAFLIRRRLAEIPR